MYINNTLRKINKIGLGLSLIFGFIVLSNAPAQAQYRNWSWRDDNRSNTSNYRYDSLNIAREYGFRDGRKDGADAAREGDRYHPENSGDWQKGTNGYESRYGSKSAYKQAYRDAYQQGYREGFGRIEERRDDRRNRRSY
jgi:hypothetical protein